MAGTLSVQKIQGLATSATPTTVEIASGHTLHAPGHVVQVVQSTYATETSSTSSSFADTGLTLNITPSSSSNKVLCIVSLGSSGVINSSGADARGRFKIVRGSTDVHLVDVRSYDYGNSGSIQFTPGCITFLDSPATTSATTYKLQQAGINGTVRVCEGNRVIAMQLLEIAQ